MKTVWKYLHLLDDKIEIEVKKGAKLLKIDTNPSERRLEIAFWFEVETDAPSVIRKFSVYGTGHEISDGEVYVGTFIAGQFVWHIYEPAPTPAMTESRF